MSKWYKCRGCSAGCVWRDDVLKKFDFIKCRYGTVEVCNQICPKVMGRTDFIEWSDDDVENGMKMMENERRANE